MSTYTIFDGLNMIRIMSEKKACKLNHKNANFATGRGDTMLPEKIRKTPLPTPRYDERDN